MFLRSGSTRRQNERLNLDTWMLQASCLSSLLLVCHVTTSPEVRTGCT